MSSEVDDSIVTEETTAVAKPEQGPAPGSTRTGASIAPMSKGKQGVTTITDKETQHDYRAGKPKSAGDQERVEEAIPELAPRLSVGGDSVSEKMIHCHQQPTRPHQSEQAPIVQCIEPENFKYHYQIHWGPSRRYHSPRDGFSPVHYYSHRHPSHFGPPPLHPTSNDIPHYPPHLTEYYPQEYDQYGYGTLIRFFFFSVARFIGRLDILSATNGGELIANIFHSGGYPNHGYGHGHGYSYPFTPTRTTKLREDHYYPVVKDHSPSKYVSESPGDTKRNPVGQSGTVRLDNLSASLPKSQSWVSDEALKCYTEATTPTEPPVLRQRQRKNHVSRQRAQQRKWMIQDIEAKSEALRTAEEQLLLANFYSHRDRKNDRSKERALEKKEEMGRILAKPKAERTKIEVAFLEQALEAKKRKNEGDRLRRERLKRLGLSTKVLKPGVSARGPLPTHLTAQNQGSEASHPLSPPNSTASYPITSPHFSPSLDSSYPFHPVPYVASWEHGAPSFENPPPYLLVGSPSPPSPHLQELEVEGKGEEPIIEQV